jgi:hypothetical protein
VKKVNSKANNISKMEAKKLRPYSSNVTTAGFGVRSQSNYSARTARRDYKLN